MEKKIIIPSLSADPKGFNEFLYIPQSLNFPLPFDEQQFLNKMVVEVKKGRVKYESENQRKFDVSRNWLQSQFKISSNNGFIEWFVKDKQIKTKYGKP